MSVPSHFSGVLETATDSENARSWSAFVCPDCRFVFRVQRDHDGDGIICPSCRRMLRIPRDGDEVAPLMAAIQKIDFVDGEIKPRGERRTRSKRKKKQNGAELPDWDASKGRWRSQNNKPRRLVRGLAVWIGCLGVIAGIIVFVVKSSEPDGKADVSEFPQVQDQFGDLAKPPLILPTEEMNDPVEIPKVMKRSEAEFLKNAELLAKDFLNANKVAQLIPLVNDPENVEKKLKAYYPDGEILPTGMTKFNSSGRVTYKDNFAAVSVQTPDFETKQLAFIDGNDGLRIDWESWVGWSEMPWQDLMKNKPSEPTLVRVMLKWVDYYNFGFSDEKKWRSYRLISPDGETMLYGYVARNSPLDQRLRPGEPSATVAVILKIRFRPDEQSLNQVVIEEYLTDGWVDGGAKK